MDHAQTFATASPWGVLWGSSLSSHIRSIPAAQSEYAAINGLDPVMLAQLALKDAQRAATFQPDSVLPHVLQVPAEEGRVLVT